MGDDDRKKSTFEGQRKSNFNVGATKETVKRDS